MLIPNEGNAGLIPRGVMPENLEGPVNVLDSWITPNELFYVRSHFDDYPPISLDSWRLTIDGAVKRELRLYYDDLRQLPAVSFCATLECSGNKRALFEPKVFGEQWETGAIGNAKWTGVPLRDILNLCKLKPEVKEIVFGGLDCGRRPDLPGIYHFMRSLPLEKALSPEVILVLEMNDQPLPYKHGFPVRLLVPGWYGMASVKWLGLIRPICEHFWGPFQGLDYVYLLKEGDYENATLVTEIRVNSMITYPSDRQILKPGKHLIRGIAWTGGGTIETIEVSTDGGGTWTQGVLTSPEHTLNTWTFWECPWHVSIPGVYEIVARATDSRGRAQPWEATWNVKGYGNNSMHKVKVQVPGAEVEESAMGL